MSRARKDWPVTCRDIAGRRRDVLVFADGGNVVMISPPGETAVLAPLEVGRLRAVLKAAVNLAAVDGAAS